MRNMGNAAEYFMFFKWKSKILVYLCIFYKTFWVKNKDTIVFTNHFDLQVEKIIRLKIDCEVSGRGSNCRFSEVVLFIFYNEELLQFLYYTLKGVIRLDFKLYIKIFKQTSTKLQVSFIKLIFVLKNYLRSLENFGLTKDKTSPGIFQRKYGYSKSWNFPPDPSGFG